MLVPSSLPAQELPFLIGGRPDTDRLGDPGLRVAQLGEAADDAAATGIGFSQQGAAPLGWDYGW